MYIGWALCTMNKLCHTLGYQENCGNILPLMVSGYQPVECQKCRGKVG